MRITAGHHARAVALPLSREACLALLSQAQSGSLACTANALPTVVPVSVRVSGCELRVALPPEVEASRLTGQIVALGASVPATPGSTGWWVVVRGELHALAAADRVLALTAFDMEGRSLPAAPRGRWWRC